MISCLKSLGRMFGELKEQQYRIHPGEFCGRRVWTDPLGWAFGFHSCEYSPKDTHAEEALKNLVDKRNHCVGVSLPLRV